MICYVKHLKKGVTETGIKAYFGHFGAVRSIHVRSLRSPPRSRSSPRTALHWLSCRAAGALLAQTCGPAADGRTPPQLRAGGRAALLRGYAAWHRRWCAATGAAVAPQWAVGQLLSAGLLLAAHAPPEPGDRPAAAAALHAVLPWHCAIYGAAHRDSRRAADCLSALGGAPADSCGDCGGSCGRPECGDRAALAGWADACAPAPAAEAAFRRRVAVPLPVSVP
eukprot:TRINITY_DN12991_c0_g1_i2.p2 TRINITY_DN12991_c0_g1~~TRINITY_DN12991_c0_g1_i2.p2  ORF type:complete len:223 (+),score=57.39 TRINITY_DN12991_c0_g1_i2:158-826(+)